MLAEPLTQDQVDATNRLYLLCPGWKLSTEALDELATRLPEFDARTVLLKAVAVNALYSTNVMAIARMADYIRLVLSSTSKETAGPELVEAMAALPKTKSQKLARNHSSFASKFANFFIDSDRFPILDKYSELMVSYHLGRTNILRDTRHRYIAYTKNLERLREATSLHCSGRELDRYLWLAGEYRTWLKNPTASINTELHLLFTEPSADTVIALKTILSRSE